MAELEDLEHQEELRSLLQDRISGEATIFIQSISPNFGRSSFLNLLLERPLPPASTQHRRVGAVSLSPSAKQRQCVDGHKAECPAFVPDEFRAWAVVCAYI